MESIRCSLVGQLKSFSTTVLVLLKNKEISGPERIDQLKVLIADLTNPTNQTVEAKLHRGLFP